MADFNDTRDFVIGNKKKKVQQKPLNTSSQPKDNIDEDPPKFQPFKTQILTDLINARQAKNLSRNDVAKQFMFKITEINDLENGKCDFNSKHAQTLYVAIMRKLGVNINLATLNKLQK